MNHKNKIVLAIEGIKPEDKTVFKYVLWYIIVILLVFKKYTLKINFFTNFLQIVTNIGMVERLELILINNNSTCNSLDNKLVLD